MDSKEISRKVKG